MILSWDYQDSELGAHTRGTIGSTLDYMFRNQLGCSASLDEKTQKKHILRWGLLELR